MYSQHRSSRRWLAARLIDWVHFFLVVPLMILNVYCIVTDQLWGRIAGSVVAYGITSLQLFVGGCPLTALSVRLRRKDEPEYDGYERSLTRTIFRRAGIVGAIRYTGGVLCLILAAATIIWM